jgi:hypothetical protein
MQGDQLTIWLFLWGIAVSFGLAATTMVDSNRTFLIRALWIVAIIFLVAGLVLPVITDFWPAVKTEIDKFSPNMAAFYVLGLAIFTLLVINFRRLRRSIMETRRLHSGQSASPTLPSASPTVPPVSPPSRDFEFADANDALYDRLKALYKDKYNGKADFYHYSGTRIHDIIAMLFKQGFTIRLFVENPQTAHNLACDFQRQRIDSMIAQLASELSPAEPDTKGRIEIYQSAAPLTVRAALLDDRRNDQHIVLGWYVYQALTTPSKGFPNDKISVWGHDGWGFMMDNLHPQFKSARKFIERYEKRICATKISSHP